VCRAAPQKMSVNLWLMAHYAGQFDRKKKKEKKRLRVSALIKGKFEDEIH